MLELLGISAFCGLLTYVFSRDIKWSVIIGVGVLLLNVLMSYFAIGAMASMLTAYIILPLACAGLTYYIDRDIRSALLTGGIVLLLNIVLNAF